MASTKSSPLKAQTPQRSNGRLRVAAILKAGAAVIAEKGFDKATMAEIAARSDTRIGSLYRFFPNKEILAHALMAHYLEQVDAQFGVLREQAKGLTAEGLADAFFALMRELHKNAPTVRQLLESHTPLSGRRGEFRKSIHKHVAEILAAHGPGLRGEEALDIGYVVLHAMKMMVAFEEESGKQARPGARGELRDMLRVYLKDRLKKPRRL